MYAVTQLFIYRPVFMLQLVIAELLFAVNLKRRPYFALRAVASLAVCFAVSFAIPVATFDTWYSTFMFLTMFFVTVGALAFSFRASFKDILFCAVAGYTIQHVVQETYEIVNVLFGVEALVKYDFYGSSQVDFASLAENLVPTLVFWICYLAAYAAAYFLFYFFFASKMKKNNLLRLNTTSMVLLVSFLLIVNVIFGSLVIYSVPKAGNTVGLLLLHIYGIACSVLSMILLFELPRRRNLEKELTAVKQLQEKERRQYEFSKKNIDLINYKCHDLKHQIHRIGADKTLDQTVVSEIENLIEVYDASYHTESEALNVILAEKSLLCRKESIELSCLVDGSKLGFMSDPDIYSVFGNLIDNAIEAVCGLDEDNRAIGLSVQERNGCIIVEIYNSYAEKLEFEDGLPRTKKETFTHGYGLKSVRYIVEKYEGEMSVSAENGIFTVTLIFFTEGVENESK